MTVGELIERLKRLPQDKVIEMEGTRSDGSFFWSNVWFVKNDSDTAKLIGD